MPLMTNDEAFRYDFGFSAIDLWQMNHENFLKWLNTKCDRERPADMVVRCNDCVWFDKYGYYCNKNELFVENRKWFCADGERKYNAV